MRRNAPAASSCSFKAEIRRAALSVIVRLRSLTSDICSALHLAGRHPSVYLSTGAVQSKPKNHVTIPHPAARTAPWRELTMLRALAGGRSREAEEESADRLACLSALERKVLWLSTWMIHQANHLRPSRDGLKVGGHQASSASVATLMTALYLDVMRPQDRVAVKPHAAPLFHALQYLLSNQSRNKWERFRALGGAQAYPSRSKDGDIVDFSTGSVGLGVGVTLFAALVQDYLRLKRLVPSDTPPGRMIALAGDAELDEGNIFEALLEGWKHDVRNLWWVVDYNRQSLDAVVSDRLFGRIDDLFEMFGWRVVTLKYGRLLQAAFARPDGEQLREWIDACPNSLYSALVYKGGEGWREHLRRDLNRYPGIRAILDEHDDEDRADPGIAVEVTAE